MTLKKLPITFHQFVFVLSCVLGLWIFFWFAFIAYEKIYYPYALNLGEPPLAQTIELMRQGISPYKSFDQAPFSLMPYGPVYPAIVMKLKALMSGHFIAARWLGSVATLIIAVVIGMFAYKKSLSFALSVVFGSVFVLMPIIQKWGIQVNVDMTALCLEIGAFILFLKYMRQKNTRILALAVVFQTLAFFTKSSAISAGASFALWHLFRRDWKAFWIYSVSQAISLLAVFGLMNQLTGGNYYLHTVYEIQNRLFFSQLIGRFWMEFASEYYWLMISLAFVIVGVLRSRKINLSMVALIVSAGLTVSLGKQGSDTNYFLSFVGYMMIVLAQAIPTNKLYRLLYSLPIAIYLLTAMPLNTQFVQDFRNQQQKSIQFYERFSNLIQNAKGPIISWDMSLLLANNRPIYYECFPMAQMAYSGVWDQKPILDAIENKKISLMVLYFLAPVLKGDRNFTPEFIRALTQNYQMIGTAETPWSGTPYWFFYIPKKTESVA